VDKEELIAMLAHSRVVNIMQAIEYEDNRPQDKGKNR
jgi:hypothetical protein